MKLSYRFLYTFTVLAAFLAVSLRAAEPINPELLTKEWKARWITHPDSSQHGFGVYYFRKTFENTGAYTHFIVHMSGDNRYQLYVNGVRLLEGPARGDLQHWRFESIDLTHYLHGGKNVVAAVVWNYADDAPMAQISSETGFILQGDDDYSQILNTNQSWKCLKDTSLTLLKPTTDGYFVAGPGEQWDGAHYPWGWESVDYDDSAWKPALDLVPGDPRGIWNGVSRWFLVPSNLPAMEQRTERLARVVRKSGVDIPEDFLDGRAAMTIPARTKATILFDQSHLTTAYPELVATGGRGAKVTLAYAEALVDAKGQKGNRNETEGKEMKGYQDRFLLEGGKKRLYRPLWWRTYRFLQADIETGDDPLKIEDLRGIFNGYPFQQRARFESDDPELALIWETSWRTARLCAHETYVDCPYYEQLQYAGDTRIQALISLSVTDDDRLVRNAIELLFASRTPEGITLSRYPALLPQFAPPYALFWIGMAHDYWRYRPANDYLRQFLPAMRDILGWHEDRLSSSGLLGKVEWWTWADWVPAWEAGIPPREPDGQSTILSLQYAGALREAADLESAFGNPERAAHYREVRSRIIEAVRKLYLASERKLVPDTPAQKQFSQHASLLAVLEDAVPPEDKKRVMQQVLSDSSLTQSTFYFRYYLHRAMKKAGLGDDYVKQLQPWRDMLAMGLTTWAENPEPVRSDCHAWSAHPNYDLLATVAGIEPAAPGFAEVRIEPNLGPLTRVDATMPHPLGDITVSYRRQGGTLKADIALPKGLAGNLVWKGQKISLHPGSQHVDLTASSASPGQ